MEEVIILHADILGVSHDIAHHYVQNRDRLESALARPLNAANYEGADLTRQAATLLWGMIEGHPFIDGNNRAAWIATNDFLNINGWRVSGTIDEHFELIVGIADRRLSVDMVDAWLRLHTNPL